MTRRLKEALERTRTWPEAAQDELAEIVLEIDAELAAGDYHATPEELEAIDEVLEQVARGEFATQEEVEAAFRAFSDRIKSRSEERPSTSKRAKSRCPRRDR
jgi:hypothetical protein